MEIVRLASHIKGDTFEGLTVALELTEVAGVPLDTPEAIDLTDCTIKAQFRKDSKTGDVVYTAIIGDGIVVDTPTSGIMILMEGLLIDWEVGAYFFDIQVTKSDATVKTYLQGAIEIVQDVTI